MTHTDDCATQVGFNGENSDVTTHNCTCKTKPMNRDKELIEAFREWNIKMACASDLIQGAIIENHGDYVTAFLASDEYKAFNEKLQSDYYGLPCTCKSPTGRTVTEDYEHQICDTCGKVRF